MEDALKFLRFLKSTTFSTIKPSTLPDPIIVADYLSDDDEDDSFFDLEITSNFDNKENTNYNTKHIILEANSENDVKKLKNQIPKHSPNEFISMRKILPIEPSFSKPQSPIALLKSAQTFKVLKFKKPKDMATKRIEKTEVATDSKGKRSLYVNFMLDDETKMSKFTSQNSQRRFELVHRYLNLLKPLYDKMSLKKMQKEKVKAACKSKSSPGALVVVPPTLPAVRRRDDSLLQQFDGIQGAILHCKRSFNSSTDSSMDLSRKSAEEMRDDVSI